MMGAGSKRQIGFPKLRSTQTRVALGQETGLNGTSQTLRG
jgi:hypothetical protein